MRLIYVVSLSHPTLLYHKNHTYMKGSAWFETFAAIFCFYTFQSLTAYKIIEKNETTKLLAKSFEKSCARGNYDEKEEESGGI